ncbi:hypothetical protein BVRB_6g145200 [Beta vulgaris subsp. vulgaris]|uniref:Uncharacterized protein n=1 Tax=Beta vulgaris subsp. vulgaris TaxID=3555 RepID=A0A0J8EXG2_BETVV|nr:hypothetical protein BVRB_6g145200 [Beta vulgaris subsp. vulgaris]
MFRVSGLSEGGAVRSRGEVCKTQLIKCKGAHPNVNCRVETLGKVVGGFNAMKVQWVMDMGFGGLLELKRRRLLRSLCYWLMTLVDTEKKVLMFPGGVDYLLDRSQVHWVLGTPVGPKRVPKVARDDDSKMAVADIRRKYGSGVGIPMVKVLEKVEGVCDNSGEYEFKTAFLILVLCDFSCPTTCRRLESDFVVVATLAMDAKDYDWSSLVLEKLLVHARHFVEKLYKHGYAKGCGGCTYFLAIASIVSRGMTIELPGGVGGDNVAAVSESDGEGYGLRRRGPRDKLNPYQRKMLRRGGKDCDDNVEGRMRRSDNEWQGHGEQADGDENEEEDGHGEQGYGDKEGYGEQGDGDEDKEEGQGHGMHEEVWILDSNPYRTENHARIIDRIVVGADMFFSELDDEWVSGKTTQWPRKFVAMGGRKHGLCSGIHVLLGIKGCAARLKFEVIMAGNIKDKRSW